MLRVDAGDKKFAGCISKVRSFCKLPEQFSGISNDSYFYFIKNYIRSDIKRNPCEKVSAFARSGTVNLSIGHFVRSNNRATNVECTIVRPAPSATRPPVRFDESGNDSDSNNFMAPTIQAASLTAWSVSWQRLTSLASTLVCSFAGLCSYRSHKIPMSGFGLSALRPVPVMIQNVREWGVGRDALSVSLYRQNGWSHSATRRRNG